MASSHPIRLRLHADLPPEVAFGGITYRLAMVQVAVSGLWQLEARWPGGYWLCVHGAGEQALRKAAYDDGIELSRATVPQAIFERLVIEGRGKVGGR
jgi:hypothetical protein